MSGTTPNIGLNVPDYGDQNWDVPVNQNWNTLDTAIAGKQATLTFDSTPTSGSSNPVTSGGIYSAIQAATPAVDNKSVDYNGSSQLEAVGVISAKDNTTAIKLYPCTKAQYTAIATKDPNILYHITDDQNISTSILELLYPVGSIYITTAEMCPLSTLIRGSTWVLVSSGKVLQGADGGHSAGTTIEAGLPNITGTQKAGDGTYDCWGQIAGSGTGAFDIINDVRTKTTGTTDLSGYGNVGISFDASRSSSIYGNSTTVQPPAYVVNIYRRTA